MPSSMRIKNIYILKKKKLTENKTNQMNLPAYDAVYLLQDKKTKQKLLQTTTVRSPKTTNPIARALFLIFYVIIIII